MHARGGWVVRSGAAAFGDLSQPGFNSTSDGERGER
jgi:hypothetical protein